MEIAIYLFSWVLGGVIGYLIIELKHIKRINEMRLDHIERMINLRERADGKRDLFDIKERD